MNEHEREIRTKLKNDFVHYASKCLKIRTKKGEINSFVLNRAQIHTHKLVEHQKLTTGKVRAIVLKGRQQGLSTLIEGRLYWLVTHRKGVRSFILTHHSDATNNLFKMAQRYHDHCPDAVKPQTGACSAKELSFNLLESGYKVGTAGTTGVGRSDTIQFLHGSEVAFWKNAAEHAKGVIQAVPDEPGTEIFLESTANGVGNYFHEQWQLAESGESDFVPIFVPWFWQDEYQQELDDEAFKLQDDEEELVSLYGLNPHQLTWRRKKIQGLSVSGGNGYRAFAQEYPNNSTEAFQLSGDDSLITPSIVMRARKNKCEAVGPLLVGVDPARFGDDRTSIIYRRGRVAYGLKSYVKKDTMETVGILHKIILTDKPARVFVDVGGLGAGIVDRLWELGFKDIVYPVNAGSSPLDAELYSNKRAEMWGECKKWLEDSPCQIPDTDSLHADLCSVRYKFDSLTRLVIEPKEQMKKRGLRSPDEAEALIHTFALPFKALQMQTSKNSEKIAQKIMSKSRVG